MRVSGRKPFGAAMALALIINAAQRQQEEPMYHRDEWGRTVGFCNSCGEESELDANDCCEDGEVVPYDDEESEEA